MPKSKGPRKKRSAGRKFNPSTHMQVPGIFRMDPDRACLSKLGPHARLDYIQEGSGTPMDLQIVTARINLAYVLVTRHFSDPEATAVTLSGLDVLRDVHARGSGVPKLASAEEFLLIAEALCLMDEIQDRTSRMEQASALEFVHENCDIPVEALNQLSV